MKKKNVICGIFAVLLAMSFIACDEEDNDTTTSGLISITANYNGTVVTPNTPINNLKASLIVTAHYNNGSSNTVNASDYTLNGNLTTEGTSTITVHYQGKTTTFSVFVSNTGVPGTGGSLTINGLPGGGTYAVYVFAAGTDVSTYQAISNAYSSGSYQAVGATVTAGNSFTLIGWNGTSATTAWTGSGNLPVLLLNATGSVTDTGNPMYSYATVNFSGGNGTANIGNFTAVVMGGGPINPGTGGSLTISGLSGSGTFAVYVFTAGTDVSTYEAISNAYISSSYQAVGATVTSGNSFTLIGWNGASATTAWTGSGNLPVLLLNATGSITDTGNPMYSYATVNFSNGNGTANISNFTAVVMGTTIDPDAPTPGLLYTLNTDGTGFVVSMGTATAKIIVIAKSYEGLPVTAIAYEGFVNNRSITNIIIPDSVITIGDYAFYGCTSLTSINVDENNLNFSSIDGILYNKAKTTIILVPSAISGSVTIPDSITSVNTSMFGSTNLTSINVNESNLNYSSMAGILYNKEKTTLILAPRGISGSITISNSVTSIGGYAFSGCHYLTSVTIGNSVTSIGDWAFADCTGLTSITIPNNVTSIGDGAFRYCNFTSITIPNNVTYIGDYAFGNCRYLTNVTISNSVTSIGKSAFLDCINLTSITIPNSVTSIGDSAFNDCRSLTSVSIGNSVTSIGCYAG